MGNQPSLQSLALSLSARNAVFAEMHSQDKKGSRGLKTSEQERRGLHAPVCLEAVFFLRDVMCRSHIILTSPNKAFSILLLARLPVDVSRGMGKWTDGRTDGLARKPEAERLPQAYKNEFNYPLAQMEDVFGGSGYISRLVEET